MPWRRLRWHAAYVIVGAAFLAAVARYYRPGSGFTFLIEFPSSRHALELPRVREAPHFDHRRSGYDGQFYAQLAVDPLLVDPDLDRAMDNAPYRARRILFSWTAYALGFGRPAWVLQVYALQNVAAWLALAWLLCRWLPPVSARHFALWTGCLLSPGLVGSVRYALTDGPALLLLAGGVALVEAGRPFLAAAALGLAGLGRETAIAGAAAFARGIGKRPATWLTAAGCALLAAAPLALWLDFLRALYRSGVLGGGDNFAPPLVALSGKARDTWQALTASGLTLSNVLSATALLGLCAQAACVGRAVLVREQRSAWTLAAAPFLLLACVLGTPVWEGSPGAYTRVLLPVTVAANVVLARTRSPWAAIALANAGVVPAVLWFL